MRNTGEEGKKWVGERERKESEKRKSRGKMGKGEKKEIEQWRKEEGEKK